MEQSIEIRPEILEFAQEMECIMRKHDERKGDSWKSLHIDYLRLQLTDEYRETSEHKDFMEYVDVANFCMMLYHRLKHKINLEQKMD
jgi:hypothetical protein